MMRLRINQCTIRKWIVTLFSLFVMLCVYYGYLMPIHNGLKMWKMPRVSSNMEVLPKLFTMDHDHILIRNRTQSGQTGRNVHCKGLLDGDKVAIAKAMEEMKEETVVNDDDVVTDVARNCSLLKIGRYYDERTVSEEERRYPIAFSMVVFKNAMQVERLLRAVFRPHNLYCIHVDKKSDLKFKFAMRSLSSCFDNVFLTAKVVDVHRGQFSTLKSELICMEQLLKSQTKWRYFINLTGQEFPLKTNWELVRILKTFNGTIDTIAYTGAMADTRATHVNSELLPKGSRPITKKPFSLSVRWFRGCVLSMLSRIFVNFLLHDQTSKMLLEYLNDTIIPEETFFPTLYYNPLFGAPGAGRGPQPTVTRYITWKFEQRMCGGKYVHGVCIVGVEDLHRLIKGPEAFLNKLYSDYQPYAMDCLEEWYHDKVRNEAVKGDVQLDMTIYHARMVDPNPKMM